MPKFLKPDETVLDRFKVLEQAEGGGQCFGYRGEDLEAPPSKPWRRPVFIKQYHDLVAGSDEAAALSGHFEELQERLSGDKNLVCLPRSSGEEANSVIAVYPWVEGKTLRDRMEDGLREEECIRIVFGLTRAVRALHENDVAHLDLKPSNVVVEEEKGSGDQLYIRVIDFDTAHIDGKGIRKITLLTQYYSSPEHYFPDEFGSVSKKSDVFTLGIMLFELLFKQHPFDETYDYPEAIKDEAFSIPASNYHREVVEEIEASLSSRPADRPTVDHLHHVLHQHYDTDLKASRPEERFEPSGGSYYVQLSSQDKKSFHRIYYDSVHLNYSKLRGSGVTRFEGSVLRLIPDADGCWLGVTGDEPPTSLEGEVMRKGKWLRPNNQQTLEVGSAKFDLEIKKYTPSSKQTETGPNTDEQSPNEGEREIFEGSAYEGKVTNITNFGAFVEIKPGIEGLVHISEIHHDYVEEVEDYLSVGDNVKVKVLEVRDDKEEYKLTRKPFVDGSEPTNTDQVSPSQETIVIDGSSVCHSDSEYISVRILLTLLLEIKDNYDITCYFDDGTFYKMREREVQVIKKLSGEVPSFSRVPGQTEADPFILQRADRDEARVISNDKYDKYVGEYPWVRDPSRVLTFKLTDNELEIPHLSGGNVIIPIKDDNSIKTLTNEVIRHFG